MMRFGSGIMLFLQSIILGAIAGKVFGVYGVLAVIASYVIGGVINGIFKNNQGIF